MCPIVMHMGIMLIITSHFTQNYDKADHKTLTPVRAKVLDVRNTIRL